MLSLTGKMTAAILPQTPFAKDISEFADSLGHDVIMHLPMEAFSHSELLGPGALMSNMDQQAFEKIFEQDIHSIPNIIGFNNHMGSLLTEDKEKMEWLMSYAKEQDFFFLDSKTSHLSVAEKIASQQGVESVSRDVFLDHKGPDTSIEIQFAKLKNIAQQVGEVIVICHPYPKTLAFLQDNISDLNEEFELVGLSDLVLKQSLKEIEPSLAR